MQKMLYDRSDIRIGLSPDKKFCIGGQSSRRPEEAL